MAQDRRWHLTKGAQLRRSRTSFLRTRLTWAQGVMDRGTLEGFQNPSALVMARIKDVKAVRKEAASRSINPGDGGSGGSSGQLTRELTREELRKAVEARKAGKGGTTSSSILG